MRRTEYRDCVLECCCDVVEDFGAGRDSRPTAGGFCTRTALSEGAHWHYDLHLADVILHCDAFVVALNCELHHPLVG